MRAAHGIIAVCALGATHALQADTIFVGPGDSIQDAVAASVDGDEIVVAPGAYAGWIDLLGKAITVRSSNGPDVTFAHWFLCITGEGSDTVIEGFTISDSVAQSGAGMFSDGSSPTVRDCRFAHLEADIVGGAVYCFNGGSPRFDGCVFDDNFAGSGGGAMYCDFGTHPVITNCLFLANAAENAAGALAAYEGTVINCRFIQNESATGGAIVVAAPSTFINCVFSRNVSGGSLPGAVLTPGTLINCTISSNTGFGVELDVTGTTLLNCIVWGNSAGSINGVSSATIAFSDIEGGWSGPGNIDADPLFAQPGTDDVRLTEGSPCLDAGENAFLPPDSTDLDGDENTKEPVPLDLDGNLRVIGAFVDMGAYEGTFALLPPAWSESNLDQGEDVVLSPTAGAGAASHLNDSIQWLGNVSSADDATALVVQIDQAMHDEAGGYTELASILTAETSMADGEFFSTTFLPFAAADLIAGAEPFDLDMTFYNPVTGGWELAVSGNTVNSPGHPGPVGDRITTVTPGSPSITLDIGDYGVHWNPQQGKGFVWANVDHATDFALGAPRCLGDVANPPDGVVTIVDLLDLLRHWGHTSGGGARWDLDGSGVVESDDLFGLLQAWGACQ